MNKIVDAKASRAAHANLYSALAAAQAEMGPALKDTVNPHFKSRYADLSSVQSACLPALNAHGIAVLQPTCRIDGEDFVKTILAHESGETAECLVPLILGKRDMQGYGSAVTYARRYGLMAMAGVAPDDDDGNAAVVSASNAAEQRAAAPRSAPPRNDTSGPNPIQVAAESLANAESIAALQAIWGDLPDAVRRADVVFRAKEATKDRLSQPVIANDEIPY